MEELVNFIFFGGEDPEFQQQQSQQKHDEWI